jgi:hypothetical protein
MPRDPSSSPERSAMTSLGLAAGPRRGPRAGLLRGENHDACGSGMRDSTRRHRKSFRSTPGNRFWPRSRPAGRTSSGTEPGRNEIRRRLVRAPRETSWNMRALGVAQHGPGSPQLVRAPWSGHGTQGRVSRPLTCSRVESVGQVRAEMHWEGSCGGEGKGSAEGGGEGGHREYGCITRRRRRGRSGPAESQGVVLTTRLLSAAAAAGQRGGGIGLQALLEVRVLQQGYRDHLADDVGTVM